MVNVLNFLAPIGQKMVSILVAGFLQSLKDKDKAKKETEKLLFAVYNELKTNVAVIGGLRMDRLNQYAVNSEQIRKIANGFKIKELEKLYEKTFPFGKTLKGKDAAAFTAIAKAVFSTRNLQSRAAMPDSDLALTSKTNTKVRIGNIKKNYLAVNSMLYSC